MVHIHDHLFQSIHIIKQSHLYTYKVHWSAKTISVLQLPLIYHWIYSLCSEKNIYRSYPFISAMGTTPIKFITLCRHPHKRDGLHACSLCGYIYVISKNKWSQSGLHQTPSSTIFPGLFFYVYIESPNPKNPEGPTPQTPKTINWKTQTPNHQKWPNIRKKL